MRTDEPLMDFARHDSRQADSLSRCPRCCKCKEHIQDDCYYESDDGYLCEECLDEEVDKWKDNHRKWIWDE